MTFLYYWMIRRMLKPEIKVGKKTIKEDHSTDNLHSIVNIYKELNKQRLEMASNMITPTKRSMETDGLEKATELAKRIRRCVFYYSFY